VLAGDHIYKMDYGAMLRFHVEHDARCTVACFEVPVGEASAFGVMDVNDEGRIVDFVEKPPQPPPMPGRPGWALASMGIYAFDAEYLYEQLARDAADPQSVHDFGRNLLPAAVAQGVAVAQPFEDACVRSEEGEEPYWRDVGTIDAYWEANIDLTATKPQLNLYDRNWPIWTYQDQLPSAKFVHNEADRRGMAVESMVSGGCIISAFQVAAVLQLPRAFVVDGQLVGAAAGCRGGPARPADPRGGRPRLQDPRRHGHRRGRRGGRPPLPPHVGGHHAGHARHAGEALRWRRANACACCRSPPRSFPG
jgi:ADP-glucose pyrophosphorylase